MPDRDKLIEQLLSIYSYFKESFDATSGTCACDLFRQWSDAIVQAIGILKAREPRVLTLDEVMDSLDTMVWVDEPGEENLSDAYALIDGYSYKNRYVRFRYISGRQWEVSNHYYGERWRCWNARPTEEQRQAVKWE